MNEPELIISGNMTRYDDIIGYVNRLHPERGLYGVLSGTVTGKETRIVFPDNLCFVATLPNQGFFHSMLMMNGAEFGFYIIVPAMLPLIRIVPKEEMWEFMLVLDDVANCWQAGFRPIGSDTQIEPYDLVEMMVSDDIACGARIIPEMAYGGA